MLMMEKAEEDGRLKLCALELCTEEKDEALLE